MKQPVFLSLAAVLAVSASPLLAQKPIGAEPAVRLKPVKPPGSGRLSLDDSLAAPTAAEQAGALISPTVEKPATQASEKELRKSKGPTEITGREAMIDNRIHQATFTGEVEVRDPEFNVRCDRLTVFLRRPKAPKPDPDDLKPSEPKSEKDSESGIEKAIAEGNTIISQEKPDGAGNMQRYLGKGKKAVFDNDKKTCTLTGWPSVTQTLEGNMSKEVISIEETTVITLTQDGRMEVKGLNRIRILNSSVLEDKPKHP